MVWDPIRKTAAALKVVPNPDDYSQTCREFSWTDARLQLEGLPSGGVNIAHEAIDRSTRARRRSGFDYPSRVMTKKDGLECLFRPRSIAIVGASATPGKAGYMAVQLLESYAGAIYPVNPRETTILGHPVYPSLTAIGVPVDLVLFAVPAAACPDLLQEAASIQAGAAIIMGGGFGESGEEGQRLQDRLADICRKTGIRMLGPNTGGYAAPPQRLVASFSVSYQKLGPGPIAVVSQSGGMSLILACMLENDGFGVSLTVGLGNAVDVDAADVIDYLADDEHTRVIALYLEGFRDGRRLFESIRRATDRKPVVALTIGRNEIGAFAQSHTGNLVGSYDLKVAAFRQAGAVIAENSNDLVDAASALSLIRLPPKPAPGVGVLIGQAGAGLLMLDQLKSIGVDVPKLSADGIARIARELPPMHYINNPVDAGRPTPEFGNVLDIIAAEEGIDAILIFVLHEPTVLDPIALFKERQARLTKPVIYGTAGEDNDMRMTARQLAELGVVPFRSPERAARAMRAVVDDARCRYRKQRRDDAITQTAAMPSLPAGALNEAQGKDLLRAIGIPVPESAVCLGHEKARAAFARLRKPVVIKVLDVDILHKTEMGGVHLNIRDADQLAAALGRIDAIPPLRERAYLIEKMANAGLDLIVGGLRDPVFGPAVLLGMGGTQAEALKDVTMRLVPLDEADAAEMLTELKARVLLDGWRGSPPVDKQAIIRALLAISRLLVEQPVIQELDINPLRAGASGVLALDALIVKSKC
ncbi:MAG: acetate--CoA ligase family protein [Gammaproteobacteria bacterium]|nr:acetate--CoA ligase family protein [Gammaproteobacteria bacterium]